MASLDHLLLLSQNQSGERERLLKEVSRAGKELVWRSENERKLFPRDAERAIVLAAKRGLRKWTTVSGLAQTLAERGIGSFLLAFSTRAGVDVLLMLFRTWRKRRLRFAMIRHAIFGSVPMRFAAMIGTATLPQCGFTKLTTCRHIHLSQYSYSAYAASRSASVVSQTTYTSGTVCQAVIWTAGTRGA